jgi:ABC-type antimicrobial peptide transport system permease subunit
VSALLWAAVLVLLIGAANIASMILARLHGEARELTVQVALGAGRGDLSRRFLAESFVLMALGLFLGLTLSGGSVGFLTRLSPVSDLGPYFQDVGVDLKVAAFGSILALAAVLLASTLPPSGVGVSVPEGALEGSDSWISSWLERWPWR